MNYWNIWGLLITAAVITLLVLVIVYMNKTTTVENKTTDIINNYNPPDTYIGATNIESETQTINLKNDNETLVSSFLTGAPLLQFTVDKNWKANTPALISGSIKFEPSDSSFPTENNIEIFGLSSNVYDSVNRGTTQFGYLTVATTINSINATPEGPYPTNFSLDFSMTSLPLNPGDVVQIYLSWLKNSTIITDTIYNLNLVSNTYTPIVG